MRSSQQPAAGGVHTPDCTCTHVPAPCSRCQPRAHTSPTHLRPQQSTGHSVMAPVGRWQKGKDLFWYARDPKAAESQEAIAAERAAIKAREQQAIEEVRPVRRFAVHACACCVRCAAAAPACCLRLSGLASAVCNLASLTSHKFMFGSSSPQRPRIPLIAPGAWAAPQVAAAPHRGHERGRARGGAAAAGRRGGRQRRAGPRLPGVSAAAALRRKLPCFAIVDALSACPPLLRQPPAH